MELSSLRLVIHLRVATSLSNQDRLFIANWRPLPLEVSEQRPVFSFMTKNIPEELGKQRSLWGLRGTHCPLKKTSREDEAEMLTWEMFDFQD